MSLQSDQQAPDDSINSLIKKYQTCDTYADRGEITLDTDGTVTGTIRFNTEFSRSRGFELTWVSHFGTLTSAKYVLRKTQHRVTVESYDTVKSYHSLYEALTGHAGTSRRLTLLVPGLLITRKDEPDAGVWLDWATRLLSGLHPQSPVSTDTNLVKLQNASFDSSVIIDAQNIILKAVELRRSRNLRKKQGADQDVESIFEDTSANTIERSSYIYEFAKFT